MGIGASLLLVAIGAILLWAVSATVAGISINTVGIILIVVGVVGLVATLLIGRTHDRTAPPAV